MGSFFRKLRSLVSGSRVKDDIQREVDLHIKMETEHRQREGMSAEEARRTALRDFGGVESYREQVHDSRGMTFWDGLRQDLRFAIRTLRRSPGFTAATILTLALGIGANTAMFSVVNEVLLRPLPYENGDALVRISQTIQRPTRNEANLSIKETMDYREALQSIDGIVEYHSMGFVLLNRGEPDEVDTGVVSSDYFATLGVKPLLGRDFNQKEDDLGAEPVLLLSHGYWQSKFGGAGDVVGQVVEMNDRPHTIIRVLPPIPAYPLPRDVYMTTAACPFRAQAETTIARNRRAFGALTVFGRLKPHATHEQARAEVAAIGQRFGHDHPGVYRPDESGFAAGIVGLNEEMVREARPILLGLLAATGLVLLIACANVANLTLARVMKRDREIALRTALGAARTRLVRQLLTESMLTSLTGGALGLAVAWLAMDAVATFASRFTPRVIDPSLDVWVLGFTLGVSMLTGVVFGIVPALSARVSLTASLKDGAAQSGDGARGRRIRSALVVAQVSVCFALVVGAGLFLQSLYRLSQVDLGFRPEQVLTARIPGNWSHHRTPQEVSAFYARVSERLAAAPGVDIMALTNAVPLSDINPLPQPISIEGLSAVDPSQRPLADRRIASERYFHVLGVKLLRGRAFTHLDHLTAPRVAVINQTMAGLWGDRDPLGGRFEAGPTTYTVVGIVGDFRQYDITASALAQYYTPTLQSPFGAGRVMLRTSGEPMALVPALKDAVYAADPQAPVEDIETLASLHAGRLASPRLNAALLAVFAGLALVITLAGLTAVIATSVSQRTREFGLRMALGASRPSVLNMVLRQGLILVAIGLAAGAFAAMGLSRLIAARLYQTTALEPSVYATVALLFVLAAVIACVGPARRATTIDPLTALRTE